MTISQHTLPSFLRDLRRWIVWRRETRGLKSTKVPYRTNGFRASSVNQRHWSTFHEAIASLEAAPDRFAGIGFVFAAGDNLVGVDLDNCICGGVIAEWALEILDRLPGYAEISPSGNGIKIFCRGSSPLDRGRRIALGNGSAIEVYSSGRYFCVTGNAIGNASTEDATEGLAWLAGRYLACTPVIPVRTAAKRRTSRAKAPAAAHDLRSLPIAVEWQRDEIEAIEQAQDFARDYPADGDPGELANVLARRFRLDGDVALGILHVWNNGTLSSHELAAVVQ